MERDLAATFTVQLDLIPVPLPVRRAEVTFAPDPAYAEFAAAAGVELIFSQPQSSIVIDASILNTPLPQANPHVASVCVRQCAELLSRRQERLGVSGKVRELLLRRGAIAAQPNIAANLGISVRTLRRKLADEETTFRELSNETFGGLTEELLAAGLTVEHIAARLGYSGAPALTHAFKSWRGTTPGRYARQRRQTAG
jgi:AraC-like DNA-binding protein